MAQPNVAREPSMEEILASIRRIIESNDPVTDAAGLRAVPDAYAFEDEGAEVEDVAFAPSLAANDPGMPLQPERRAMPEPVAVAPAPSAERSLSLADVAARVRAASVRHQEIAAARPAPRQEEPALLQPEPVVEPPVETSAGAAAAFAPLSTVSQAPSAPEMRPLAGRPVDVPQARVPDYSAAPMEERRVDTALEPTLDTVPGASAPRLPVQMEAMSSLLSEAAGAQVAKSFGELADVFNGLERRSVEEMAEDMLRPMLQEWLDDNLPTLVERLVREEIERVARGPRK